MSEPRTEPRGYLGSRLSAKAERISKLQPCLAQKEELREGLDRNCPQPFLKTIASKPVRLACSRFSLLVFLWILLSIFLLRLCALIVLLTTLFLLLVERARMRRARLLVTFARLRLASRPRVGTLHVPFFVSHKVSFMESKMRSREVLSRAIVSDCKLEVERSRCKPMNQRAGSRGSSHTALCSIRNKWRHGQTLCCVEFPPSTIWRRSRRGDGGYVSLGGDLATIKVQETEVWALPPRHFQ